MRADVLFISNPSSPGIASPCSPSVFLLLKPLHVSLGTRRRPRQPWYNILIRPRSAKIIKTIEKDRPSLLATCIMSCPAAIRHRALPLPHVRMAALGMRARRTTCSLFQICFICSSRYSLSIPVELLSQPQCILSGDQRRQKLAIGRLSALQSGFANPTKQMRHFSTGFVIVRMLHLFESNPHDQSSIAAWRIRSLHHHQTASHITLESGPR